MFERGCVALVITASLAGTPLDAQTTPQLEARGKRLEALGKVLDDSVARVESERFDRASLNYFTVAGVTFGYPVEIAGVAARVLAPEAERWRARYGNALAHIATDTVKVVIDPRLRTDGPLVRISWRFAGQSGEAKVLADELMRGRWVTWLSAQVLQSWEASLLGPPIRGWFNDNAPPTGGGDDRLARSDLLFSRSSPARRCLEGNLGDCERALVLKEGADPFTEWYDRPDLVAVVRNHWDERAPGRASCLATGELEACRTAMGGSGGRGYLLPPTRTEVRTSLYLYALAQGGPDALNRIHAAGDLTVARQLEMASGMSIDSLLAGWHAALISQRGGQDLGDVMAGLILAALWSAVLLALFAWRFRWHHV